MKSGQLRAADYSDAHNIERITDTGRITWLLTRLMENRELLTICIQGSKDKFTSTIIKVDAGEGQAHLDELMPRDGNKLLAKNCGLEVTGRLEGINIEFNLSHENSGEHDGLVHHVACLPETVNYWQRRDTHRVKLPLAPTFPVTLVAKDTVVGEGQLRDISHGGAQVIFKSETGITPRTMLYECAFELPGDTKIYCTVDVRYAFPHGKHNDIRAGIRFLDLTPYQQRIIDQCVASVELEYIRKHAL